MLSETTGNLFFLILGFVGGVGFCAALLWAFMQGSEYEKKGTKNDY